MNNDPPQQANPEVSTDTSAEANQLEINPQNNVPLDTSQPSNPVVHHEEHHHHYESKPSHWGVFWTIIAGLLLLASYFGYPNYQAISAGISGKPYPDVAGSYIGTIETDNDTFKILLTTQQMIAKHGNEIDSATLVFERYIESSTPPASTGCLNSCPAPTAYFPEFGGATIFIPSSFQLSFSIDTNFKVIFRSTSDMPQTITFTGSYQNGIINGRWVDSTDFSSGTWAVSQV